MDDVPHGIDDAEAEETRDWLESLDDVHGRAGAERVTHLLRELHLRAHRQGVRIPFTANTPYINTIPAERAARLPGQPRARAAHQEPHPLERHGHGRARQPRGGGHRRAHLHLSPRRPRCTRWASTTSSARRPTTTPATWSTSRATPRRASTRAPSSKAACRWSRSTTSGTNCTTAPGLSSYPHPWLMPDFWQFPTVSMGLGPIMAIYHARFIHYLEDRGLRDAGGPEGLGLPGRRRDGRARDPRRHHPGRRARSSTT